MTTFQWFALKGGDIRVTNADGAPTADRTVAAAVPITLRGSKTNQCNAPTVRLLSRSGHRYLCPVLIDLLLSRARRGLPAEIPAAVFGAITASPNA
ncbi:hypothetical protein PI124_g20013 [Phytophthora idaei]|nr:hypothetical protein PI125_g18765 [Phytophthora idaei]KAG3137608.1 hypothetical protein PI126_g17314 [Phytophthora idaei]KAG3234941.1 hypothetical protein PI124_g20013 [Phytophthora idaei]